MEAGGDSAPEARVAGVAVDGRGIVLPLAVEAGADAAHLVGGIDPSFQFALDWDLLARFQQAGCRMVRLPYFLGAFRVHSEQKTSQAIHTVGAEEMKRIRTRFHGEKQDDFATIDRFARRTRFRGALVARLLEAGIRW